MAYFERTDERDMLVVCNICEVSCSERSLTKHRIKCSARHEAKFKEGKLIRCTYDSGHIIPKGKLDDHLEFCNKRQCESVSRLQLEARDLDEVPGGSDFKDGGLDNIRPIRPAANSVGDVEDWGEAAAKDPFSFKFQNLSIK